MKKFCLIISLYFYTQNSFGMKLPQDMINEIIKASLIDLVKQPTNYICSDDVYCLKNFFNKLNKLFINKKARNFLRLYFLARKDTDKPFLSFAPLLVFAVKQELVKLCEIILQNIELNEHDFIISYHYALEQKNKFIIDLFNKYVNILWAYRFDKRNIITIYNEDYLKSKINYADQPDVNKITIKYLLLIGVNINVVNYSNYTILMGAVQSRKKDIVDILLTHPDINVSAKNDYGCSALRMTSDKDITKLLLNHSKIDINMQDRYGHTDLINTAIYGYENKAKLLLAHPNIDVNIQDTNNETAILHAIINKHKNMVKLLLNNPDLNINVQNNLKQTALIIATLTNQPDIVRLLLQYRPDKHIKNKLEQTAYDIARECNFTEIIELLMEDIALVHEGPWCSIS